MNSSIIIDGEVLCKCAADIVDKPQEYLWTAFLPIGLCSVIFGTNAMPVTETCCAIAANATSGNCFVGDTAHWATDVCYVSTKWLAEQIKQSIKVQGGDLNNVHVFDYQKLQQLDLETRFVFLDGWLQKIQPKLLIIDSFEQFVSPFVSLWDDHTNSNIAHKLRDLAKKYDCSVLLSTGVDARVYEHAAIINDDGDECSNLAYAMYGSGMLMIHWKSIIMVDYLNDMVGNKFVLKHVKASYSAEADSVAFELIRDKLTWLGTVKGQRDVYCYDSLGEWWWWHGKALIRSTTPVSECYESYISYCTEHSYELISSQKFAKQLCKRYSLKSVGRSINNKSVRVYVTAW